MAYRPKYSPRSDRQLERLPASEQRRILRGVRQLVDEPRGPLGKRLRGPQDLWTSRVGDLRIIYAIDDRDRVIYVRAVGNRSNIYEIVRRLR